MSMIHSLLQDYQLNKDITAFLLELKAKAVTASPYRIDELYAIMPPIEVIWQNTNDTIKLHQLNGILTIQTQWDDLQADFWYAQGNFFCSSLQCLKQSWKLELTPEWDKNAYQQMIKLTMEKIELLRAAFHTPLLHIPVIRQQLQQKLLETNDALLQNCIREMFIILLNEDIPRDELFNQDLFLKRAKIRLTEIFARRASLTAKPEYREKHAQAAIRSSELFWQKLFPTVMILWGHLANQPYFTKKIQAENNQNYAFEETYYPNGRITLSEIFPIDKNSASQMIKKIQCDVYREIFPDYDMAAFNRKIAAELILQR